MEPFIFPMEGHYVPGALFETPHQFELNDGSTTNLESMWMDVDLDIGSSSELSIFHELENIPEVTTNKFIDLTDVVAECGIPAEEEMAVVMPQSPASSLNSDMESHQSLIDELEEFFGSPTEVEEEVKVDLSLDLVTTTTLPQVNSPDSILSALQSGLVEEVLTEQDLKDAVTTTCVTEDGQNVIIIIAPSSPAPPSPPSSICDSDPDWSPSSPGNPSSCLRSLAPTSQTIRKKYARTKPPTPPTGPYPIEKKERKKAQNRTAAFRYREKKKNEQDDVDSEVDLLQANNIRLKERLSEMEAECRLLKKLMTEAGLGRYASKLKL